MAVLLASACTHEAAPAPAASTSSPAAVQATAASAPPLISRTFVTDLESDEGIANLQGQALKAALSTCGADHWLAQNFQTRLQQLRELGIECKQLPHESGLQAECPLPTGTRSFGGHAASSLVIFDEGNVHESNISVAAAGDVLAAAMAKDTMTELTEFGASAGMYLNLLDDRYRHIVWQDDKHPKRSTLNCRMNALDADAEQAERSEDQGSMPPGTISGQIKYPKGQGNGVPAMRICALHEDATLHTCTQTSAGQTHYQIENLAAADNYLVRADTAQVNDSVGGHTDHVTCNSPRCDTPPLTPVAVTPGHATTGIDLDFFREAGTWPAMPAKSE